MTAQEKQDVIRMLQLTQSRDVERIGVSAFGSTLKKLPMQQLARFINKPADYTVIAIRH